MDDPTAPTDAMIVPPARAEKVYVSRSAAAAMLAANDCPEAIAVNNRRDSSTSANGTRGRVTVENRRMVLPQRLKRCSPVLNGTPRGPRRHGFPLHGPRAGDGKNNGVLSQGRRAGRN